MNYQDEQRQELNSKLRECIEKISEANRYEKLINNTRQDYSRLEKKWQELKKILEKEEHDVEKLNKMTFTNFLHTILNDKTEKLDKEKHEALTAKLKCDSVFSQLQECKITLSELTEKYNLLNHTKEDYEALLKKKRNFILAYMPSKWNEIEKLIEKDKIISSQLKEINEAIDAGNHTLTYINHAMDALQSAENWGTWDMLGGGLIATMAKREKMSKAQDYITDMQKWISTFARELKDVDTSINSDLQLDSFLGFADYFFDGFFVDWAVQSKIHSAQNKVNNTYSEVKNILRKLRFEANNLNKRRKEIDNSITTIIENA